MIAFLCVRGERIKNIMIIVAPSVATQLGGHYYCVLEWGYLDGYGPHLCVHSAAACNYTRHATISVGRCLGYRRNRSIATAYTEDGVTSKDLVLLCAPLIA